MPFWIHPYLPKLSSDFYEIFNEDPYEFLEEFTDNMLTNYENT